MHYRKPAFLDTHLTSLISEMSEYLRHSSVRSPWNLRFSFFSTSGCRDKRTGRCPQVSFKRKALWVLHGLHMLPELWSLHSCPLRFLNHTPTLGLYYCLILTDRESGQRRKRNVLTAAHWKHNLNSGWHIAVAAAWVKIHLQVKSS